MAVRITTDQIHELEAQLLPGHERDLAALCEHLAEGGVDVGAVISEIRRFSVAAPSWALGTGGTRFGRFPRGGEPRTASELLGSQSGNVHEKKPVGDRRGRFNRLVNLTFL